jgi:hypothetical protein
MTTKGKQKATRVLPSLPSFGELGHDVRSRINEAISGMAGEESVYERHEGGHTGAMTVELKDGSEYRVTIDVFGDYEDMFIIGAKLVREAEAEDAD